MKIGQLAEKSGLAASTIRFYERKGLLPKARRLPSGYRDYDVNALEHLQLIKFSQSLGFTLDELPTLLDTGEGVDHEVIMQRLKEKQRQTEVLLQQLIKNKTKMDALVDRLSQLWGSGQCMEADELASILETMS